MGADEAPFFVPLCLWGDIMICGENTANLLGFCGKLTTNHLLEDDYLNISVVSLFSSNNSLATC